MAEGRSVAISTRQLQMLRDFAGMCYVQMLYSHFFSLLCYRHFGHGVPAYCRSLAACLPVWVDVTLFDIVVPLSME